MSEGRRVESSDWMEGGMVRPSVLLRSSAIVVVVVVVGRVKKGRRSKQHKEDRMDEMAQFGWEASVV
jgi:hypothetical protein